MFGIDLNTGTTTTYRKIPGEYNEVEGIFPDGRFTLVESSREQAQHDSNHIDLWKLRLEPESTDFVRMTRWGDFDGFKASNPVVRRPGAPCVRWRKRFDMYDGPHNCLSTIKKGLP